MINFLCKLFKSSSHSTKHAAALLLSKVTLNSQISSEKSHKTDIISLQKGLDTVVPDDTRILIMTCIKNLALNDEFVPELARKGFI